MRKARILLFLGTWIAVLPYLGFPYSWKDTLSFLTGLVIICFSYVLYKDSKKKEVKEKTFDNFKENIPEIKIDEVKSDSQKDENVLVSITSEHCNSECKAFESNFEFLEYCQQVCGISPAKEVSASDCEAKKDLRTGISLKNFNASVTGISNTSAIVLPL